MSIYTINVQNYFQLISSYKVLMQEEKTLTQILVSLSLEQPLNKGE